ncbi:MAG: GNAT family N-acetyltransferase [Gemmatimonadota bacterium]
MRLVPLSLDHLDELCEVGLDEELWRWTLSRVRTREEMRSYVEAALEAQHAGTALAFAIVDAASGRVAGSTRYAALEPTHRRLEIGWTWLGRPWQRSALNTEAKLLLLRHAFEALSCVRVEFKTDALNERSRLALLRIGAVEEGTLRAHLMTAGGRLRDSVYYSILASEWPAVAARLELRLERGAAASRPAAPERDERPAGNGGAPAGETRALPVGFELDDDPRRVDLDEVCRFLSTTYWAAGRPREEIERLVREASRVVGLYRDGEQVGFARTVSDGAAFAYLADVYVLPELRGRGLGLELVREAVDRGPFAARRWLLHTLDAHGLYARLGFGRPSVRLMERGARAAADAGATASSLRGPAVREADREEP